MMDSGAILTSIPFRAFHNALRAMSFIEHDELQAAGACQTPADFAKFASDPRTYLITCSDDEKAAIWTLIQENQPTALRARA